MRSDLTQRYAPILATGLLLGAAFPTWHVFPLAWVGLVPLLWAVRQATPRETGARFFAAGMILHLFVLQWLLTNFYWAGGWAFWAHVALCAILSAYWFVLGALWRWLQERIPWVPHWLTLAVLWGAMESLQAVLFSGFGWVALANTQGQDLALLQWAAVGGAPLVAMILVACNALLAGAIMGRRRVACALGAVAIVAVSHGGGALLLAPADYDSRPFVVGLVQPDFPLEMKWDDEYTVDMVANVATKSRTLAENEPIDLFVWPESLIMDEIGRPEIHELTTELAKDTGAYLYTGCNRTASGTGEFFNSSYVITPSGEIEGFYDKIHLAPFGEYAPFTKWLPFIRRVVPAISDITAGAELKVFDVGERRLGPLICFEVLFAPMAEHLRRQGADMLAVITNLGWFGASNAIPQEIEIARIRAIETRLPLVHCANTGISGVFDPYGRFTVANVYIDPRGRYYEISDVAPRDTIQRRLEAVLPVAAPGHRPVPGGPAAARWVAWALATALVIAGAGAAWRARRKAPGAATNASGQGAA